MTVAQLIKHLRSFPADARVVMGLELFGRSDVLGVFAEPVKACQVVCGSNSVRYLNARECRDDREPFEPTDTVVVIAMHEAPVVRQS